MKYVNRPHPSLPFFPSLNRIKVFKDLDGQSYTKKMGEFKKAHNPFYCGLFSIPWTEWGSNKPYETM